jgi:hypothetical protein
VRDQERATRVTSLEHGSGLGFALRRRHQRPQDSPEAPDNTGIRCYAVFPCGITRRDNNIAGWRGRGMADINQQLERESEEEIRCLSCSVIPQTTAAGHIQVRRLAVRPSHSDIKPEDVRGRAEVGKLLPSNPVAALDRARAIQHPWYRCQSLTNVAENEKSRSVAVRLLNEALRAAREQTEPNRVVSVASWPLRELVKRDASAARAVTEELLRTICTEPHGLRRLDGLNRILWAVADNAELRQLVQPAFSNAASQSAGWRTERTVAFMATYLAKWDRPFAQALLESREPNRFRNAAEKELTSEPRA